MQSAIYKNGIKGKNFIEQVESSVGEYAEIHIADFLEETIADSLASMFIIK